MKIYFQKWLSEVADYGFLELEPKKEKIKNKNITFKVDEFLDCLSDILISENKKVIRKWAEEVIWEENGKIIEVNVNPFGSLRITTRKYINDLKGNKIRICKDVFDLEDEHNGKEHLVAEAVRKRFEKYNSDKDYPVKDKNIKNISKMLFKECLKYHPDYIMFPKGIRKIDENYYKIYFEFKGQGAGAPNSVRAEQFDIDISFDKEKGLIRCWGYNIDSPMKKRLFMPQPTEWDEYFSPNERDKRIVKLIIKTFMTY